MSLALELRDCFNSPFVPKRSFGVCGVISDFEKFSGVLGFEGFEVLVELSSYCIRLVLKLFTKDR